MVTPHTQAVYSPTVPTHHLQDEGPLVTVQQHITLKTASKVCPLNKCSNIHKHTSVLWWWWRPLSLLCDAGQSLCRWSCRCHRNHCQWSPPCQQYEDGRNPSPQLMWSYLRPQVTTLIGVVSLKRVFGITETPKSKEICAVSAISIDGQIFAKGHLRLFNSLTSFDQVCQQLTPLIPELVCTSQTAVTTNHTQVGDAQFYQVTGSLGASLLGAEILTAGASNHSTTLTLSK